MEEEAAAGLLEGLLCCPGARPEHQRHLSRRLEDAQCPKGTLECNVLLARRAAGRGLRTAMMLVRGAPLQVWSPSARRGQILISRDRTAGGAREWLESLSPTAVSTCRSVLCAGRPRGAVLLNESLKVLRFCRETPVPSTTVGRLCHF